MCRHATKEEAEQEPSTYDCNIVPPSQDARPKFQCMPRLPGGFIAESEMEDDDTEHDHTKHLYCEMQDAQHVVYTQVEVPMDTLCEEGEEESETINEGNDQSESLLAPKETQCRGRCTDGCACFCNSRGEGQCSDRKTNIQICEMSVRHSV